MPAAAKKRKVSKQITLAQAMGVEGPDEGELGHGTEAAAAKVVLILTRRQLQRHSKKISQYVVQCPCHLEP